MGRKSYSRRYQSEYNWLRLFWQFYAITVVCKPFWSLFYKIKVEGRENIPKGEKIILAGNHISYFDPFLLFLATYRPVAFMAKVELFARNPKNTLLTNIIDNWRIGWMDRLGAFSVNREKLEVSTIKTARDVLKTKRWTLGIFPQGGIRKNGKIEKVNKGFAVLAKMVKVDILPISITGCESYNWNFWHKKHITIKIGEKISAAQDVDDICEQWGRSVATMCNYEYVPEKAEVELKS